MLRSNGETCGRTSREGERAGNTYCRPRTVAAFGVLALNCVRQLDSTVAVRAPPVAHHDLPIVELDVLDAKPQRLEQAQPRAVEQACDEPVLP